MQHNHVNRVGRADVVPRPKVARGLGEPVEPVKLFPGVLLSETAAHRFGSVGRAVDASQRLPAETLDAFSPHFCGTECPLGRGDGPWI